MTTTFSQSPGVVGLTLRQISAVTELFSTDQTDIRTADSKELWLKLWKQYKTGVHPYFINGQPNHKRGSTTSRKLGHASDRSVEKRSSKFVDVLKMCLGPIYVCLSGDERAPQKKDSKYLLIFDLSNIIHDVLKLDIKYFTKFSVKMLSWSNLRLPLWRRACSPTKRKFKIS